ncbi:uncharacterized protein [Nicotiana sylvestris]|uniref:uncharacterized protein n=1 Tax=Nicotiana sylvestris TaxID=4096 RepID=UPI00388C446B
MNLQFENGLQATVDEGEKKKLTQENEALKVQIRKMRIAARNLERSRADERLISSLRKKALECQVRNLQFENGLQATADEGEKKKLTQENEALKVQIRKMRIASRNPERSRADERLISSLRKKALECQDNLEKSEVNLAKVQAQLAKNAEGRAHFVQQMKRRYEGTITSLKRKVTTLENEAAKQAKDFKADREHCYDLMA